MTQNTAKHHGMYIEYECRPAREQIRTPAPARVIDTGPSQTSAIQLILVAIAALAIPMAWLVPTELVLPSISLAAVSLAAIVAAIAWSSKAADRKESGHVNLRDVAGIFAFIGFGAGMLSEPEAIVQLIAGRAS